MENIVNNYGWRTLKAFVRMNGFFRLKVFHMLNSFYM